MSRLLAALDEQADSCVRIDIQAAAKTKYKKKLVRHAMEISQSCLLDIVLVICDPAT